MQIGTRGIKGLGGFIRNAEQRSGQSAKSGVLGEALAGPDAAVEPERLVLDTLIRQNAPMTLYELDERRPELDLRQVVEAINGLAQNEAIVEEEATADGQRRFAVSDLGRVASEYFSIGR
ncbi:MAG: hypothetical protein ABIT04_13605 [Novosphingobium sp.]